MTEETISEVVGGVETEIVETLEGFTLSPLAKTLIFFVGGAACGVMIGLAIATLTREPPIDFVAPPSGAYLTGDDLLDAVETEDQEHDA